MLILILLYFELNHNVKRLEIEKVQLRVVTGVISLNYFWIRIKNKKIMCFFSWSSSALEIAPGVRLGFELLHHFVALD